MTRPAAERRALLVGGSDGIGLATTRALLARGWRVTGVSRSPSPVEDPRYRHHVQDVTAPDYVERLGAVLGDCGTPDVLIYCAGIGETLEPADPGREEHVFAVNLQGLVRSVAAVLPGMRAVGRGQVIGLSSIGDDVAIPDAPSYSASKAAMSSWLNGLGLRLRREGIAVTNVRFGFVDTKMARARWRPMMMSPERAAGVLLRCIERRPLQMTVPRRAGLLLRGLRWAQRLRVWTARG